MEFKDRIKMLREEKKINLTQLAVQFDLKEAGVRAWELGRTKPNVDTLIKLAKYFDCTVDYLLGLSDTKNREKLNELNNDLQQFSQAFSNLSPDLQGEFLPAITSMLALLPPNEVEQTLRGMSFKYLTLLIGILGSIQNNFAVVLSAKERGLLADNEKITHFIAQHTNKNSARDFLDAYLSIADGMIQRLLDIKSEEEYLWYMDYMKDILKSNQHDDDIIF